MLSYCEKLVCLEWMAQVDIIDLQVCLSNITVMIIIKKMVICITLALKQRKPTKGSNTLTQSLKKFTCNLLEKV